MRPLRVRTDPPAASLAWALLLALLVGAAALGRFAERPFPGGPAPSPTGKTATTAPDLEITQPAPGLFWHATGLIPVRGRTTLGLAALLGTVRVGGRIIGSGLVPVEAGGIRGYVPIRPPLDPASGTMRLVDARHPRARPLATIPLDVEAGVSILLWQPADPDAPIQARELEVGGPIVEPVDRVVARVTTPNGTSVAEAETRVVGRDSFDLRVVLPRETPAGKLWLHVSAYLDGERREVTHLDQRLIFDPAP
ncbi:MAG TPA: hypothetical protein VGQ47_02005 [Candidatus Limnocylindrales bacterium]|jgi:hypothetical protein|nr:hypothetical protein [Candidatus Limnocylindrales bacterium]